MLQKNLNSRSFWLFDNLQRHNEIGHFISSRTGGCSLPPYDSLNLGFHVGDDPNNVVKNRKILAQTLGIPMTGLTTAKQVHGCQVRFVSEAMKGRGASDYDSAIDATDAMVTNVPGICLVVLVADCVPILFYDPSKKVIGVAHAGWKGTLGFIAQKTVRVFKEDFGCSPKDILAGIGPSIGPCCYEVGDPVTSQAQQVLGTEEGYLSNESLQGTAHFDLWRANKNQLIAAGVSESNIRVANMCTSHYSSTFFSYRKEKGKTGRFGAGILICDDYHLNRAKVEDASDTRRRG